MTKTLLSLVDIKTFIVPVFLAVLLVITSQFSFLLFHTLAEFFAIVIAILTTVVAWQMYSFTRNHFLMYLGCGYFWIAALDMIHSLSYKGMSIVPATADVPIQLWIGTRYLEALLLLTAPWFLAHSLKRNAAFALFFIISSTLTILIVSGNFPIAFIEGQGLTKFKVNSEYLIITILAVAIYYLCQQKKLIDHRVFILMIASIVLTMIAELAFTFYVDVYGLSNLVGHIFKLFSFWLIFVAVVRTTLREPFSALSKSETYYDAIPDATIIVDEKGIIQHVNEPACSLANQSSVELIGKQSHSVFHNKSTDYNKCTVCQTISHGTELSAYDMQVSETSWFEYSTSSIQGEKCFTEVIRDITDKHLLREAAAKSKRDLQAIMDNSPTVIYVKDTDGHFTFINKKFEQLFHIQKENIIGETLHDIFPKDIADEMQLNDKEIIKTGHALESEEIAPQDDGPHTYSSIKFPLFNDDNEIYAVCGISTDITKRKQQDEQLRRSQKMDALGKLTGGIAHDYNNMLGVILGYAELLKDMLSEQPKLAKYADEIHHAGERGTKLTQQLLSFSRKKPSDASMLNINTLLQDEKNMLEKVLTVRIKLTLKLSEDLWPVWLDSGDLEDAIVNISINAMHAIDGNGELIIQTSNEVINDSDVKSLQIKAGNYVKLSIVDTGCGMSKETREKIFEPFFSTKGKKGTGLGLSQVYGFVERSNGMIKVYSELGQGSQFSLYFPQYHESDSDVTTTPATDVSSTKLSGKETILVVDDETQLLNLTSEILGQQGYQVLCAENGKQALDILENESIDLLLSDIIMPEMDGNELAAIVQKKYPSIKIQLASGFSDNHHTNMMDENLQKNILPKPYHSQALLKRIRQLLDNEEIN